MTFTKILVAEDIDNSNKGVVAALKDLGEKDVRQSQTCDGAFLKMLQAQQKQAPFDLLVSDLSFITEGPEPKIATGQELISKIKAVQLDIKIIVFTGTNKQGIVKELYKGLGVDAYVCKGLHGLKELQKAMQAVVKGERYVCPIAKAALQQNIVQLNDYEKQLLQLVAQGYKHKGISTYFKSHDITPNSERSIEDHLSKLRDHFNATTTAQLIYLTQNLGLI